MEKSSRTTRCSLIQPASIRHRYEAKQNTRVHGHFRRVLEHRNFGIKPPGLEFVIDLCMSREQRTAGFIPGLNQTATTSNRQ